MKKGDENYTLVAFPQFFSLENWNVSQMDTYLRHFATESIEILENPYQIRDAIESFLVRWDGKGGITKVVDKDKIPFFSVTSPLAFLKKSVKELDYAKIKFSDPRDSEVKGNLTEGMAESDLCLIVPPGEDYKITRMVEQEQGNGGGNKKPDKTNHQCQKVHDKLGDWEVSESKNFSRLSKR